MTKRLIKRYTIDPARLKEHKHLRQLGSLLHDENLWHLNRRSTAGGVAAGLFWAMIPIPLQMFGAALTAVVARINLPISVALVWITNPLTIPPIFYFNYRLGAWLLDQRATIGEFHLSAKWMADQLGLIWKPLITGSLVMAVVLAAIGYAASRLLWRWHALQRYRSRPGSNRNGDAETPPGN